MTFGEWLWHNLLQAASMGVLAIAGAVGLVIRNYAKSMHENWQKMVADNATQSATMAAQGVVLTQQAAAQTAMAADIKAIGETAKSHGNDIAVIRKQVLPNGGKSLMDAVGRLDKKVEIMAASYGVEFKHRKDALARIDPKGEIEKVSEGYTDLTGLDAHAARHEGWRQTVHPKDRSRVASEWREAVANKRHATIRYRVIRRDKGQMVAVEANAETMRSAQAKVDGEPPELLGWNSMITVLGEWEPLDETAPDPYAA